MARARGRGVARRRRVGDRGILAIRFKTRSKQPQPTNEGHTMTRKHFQAIADTLRHADVDADTRKALIADFARLCASYNGRFDRGRFAEAATPAA